MSSKDHHCNFIVGPDICSCTLGCPMQVKGVTYDLSQMLGSKMKASPDHELFQCVLYLAPGMMMMIMMMVMMCVCLCVHL